MPLTAEQQQAFDAMLRGGFVNPQKPQPTPLQQWGAAPAAAYNNAYNATAQQNQKAGAGLGSGLASGLAALLGAGSQPRQNAPQGAPLDPKSINATGLPTNPTPPPPTPPPNGAPTLDPKNPQSMGLKGMLGNAASNAATDTGYDINKPVQSLNFRSPLPVNKPPVESVKPTDPATGQPVTTQSLDERQQAIYKQDEDLNKQIDKLTTQIASSNFTPTEHHTTKASMIAAGATALLGALLGPKSGLGSGLLQGLTNTISGIHALNQEQYTREAEQYAAKQHQQTDLLAAYKAKGDILSKEEADITAQRKLEEKRLHDQATYAKWSADRDLRAKDIMEKWGFHGAQLEQAQRALNERIRNDGYNNYLGHLNAVDRITAEADINQWHIGELAVQQFNATNKATMSPVQKANMAAASKAFEDVRTSLAAQVADVDKRTDIDADAKALLKAQVVKGAHPQFQAAIDAATRAGIDTSAMAAAATQATAGYYATMSPDELEANGLAAPAPYSGGAPTYNYYGTPPPQWSAAQGGTTSLPQGGWPAPPTPGGSPGAPGGAQPASGNTSATTQNLSPHAPSNTTAEVQNPGIADDWVKQWSAYPREAQQQYLEQNKDKLGQASYAYLTSVMNKVHPGAHAPETTSKTGTHQKEHISPPHPHAAPPAQAANPEAPVIDSKEGPRPIPVIGEDGTPTTQVMQHVPHPPRGAVLLDPKNPHEGTYFFKPFVGWIPYVKNPLATNAANAWKWFTKPGPAPKPGEIPGYPIQQSNDPYAVTH